MRPGSKYVAAAFACLLATGTLLFAASIDITDTVKRSFDVAEGGELHIEMDYGSLEVATHAEPVVRVTVERVVDTDDEEEAREILEHHDLEMEEDGDGVYVSSDVDKSDGWWDWFGGDDADVDVNISVLTPERYDVDFEAGAGNVDVRGITGSVEGEAGAGNISVQNAQGEVNLSSGAGNIVLLDVGGVLDIATGAGNVEAELTRALTGASSVQSGMGNVSVRIGPNVGLDVEANTGMGSVSSDFDLNEESAWMSGSASGEINGGGASLELNTGMGSISIEELD